MVRIEIGYRQDEGACRASGSGDTDEAALADVLSASPAEALDGASEVEVLRLEIDGLDLTGATRRAEDAALSVVASFADFGSPSGMEAAIRGYQEARAASAAYQAKADAILARCEAHWGWRVRGEPAREE